MNKFIKGTIFAIGFILCLIVLMLNIILVTQIDDSSAEARESIIVRINQFKDIIITTAVVVVILGASTVIQKTIKKKWLKILGIALILVIYILLQILWINKIDAYPVYDQQYVYDTAVLMYKNETDKMLNNQYLELYPHQTTLATLYALIFKICDSSSAKILQYLNAISNALTILAIILISNHLGKDYQTNKARTLIISIGFVTLPLLSTFIYGDILSIPMCMLAIYFSMKYSQSKKIRFAIVSMFLMASAYIVRMNNLIYIISITIYLFLDILKPERKELLKKIIIAILFVAISIMPATEIKLYWQNKLQLNEEKQFPVLGFICMGMQEGVRAKGWYNQDATWAFIDPQMANVYYKIIINQRINEFIISPNYFVKFYAIKIATMWTENTYASLWYNKGHNLGGDEFGEYVPYQERETDQMVDSLIKPVQILQKAIVLIIFAWTILVLIKNRKKLSNEILLLVTSFIGGFLFHTIWEAKSRYIISYIVVLMPITAVSFQGYMQNFIKNIKRIRNGEKNEIINSNSNL